MPTTLPEQHSRYERIPQTPREGASGDALGSSPYTAPAPLPLGLSELCITSSSQRGSTRAHVAPWHLLLALAALCAEQAAVTLTCFGFRPLKGCAAAKRSWWRHPGCLPWRGTGMAPALSGSHLPPIISYILLNTVGFFQGVQLRK